MVHRYAESLWRHHSDHDWRRDERRSGQRHELGHGPAQRRGAQFGVPRQGREFG
jgi:hypothetical protein